MAFVRQKYLLLVALLTIQVYRGQAQSTLQVMLEQLAALKGYASTAEKGYRIAEHGIHLVRDITSGEFDLHQVYFGSLKKVDEATLQWPALVEAEQLIVAIDQAFTHSMTAFASSGWLQRGEVQYIRDVQEHMAKQGRDDRATLGVLTQDGQLSMTDGERISKINELVAGLRTRYRNVKAFLMETAWIVTQRQKEGNYIQTLKKWYGLQ